MSHPTRLLAIMRKEVLQLKRDKISMRMIVGIPVMQLLLFGYAINMDVRNLSAAVSDQSNTHMSRQFVADLGQTQVLNFVAAAATPMELEALLRTGKISIGIHIPSDFDARVADDSRAAAHLLVDGADPTILGVANQLATMPLRFDSAEPRQGRRSTLEVRPFYNPERRTAVNIVPGLAGVILTITMMMFTAVAIVREREQGNLEFLINTPVSTAQLMVGKVVPYVVIGLIQLGLVVALGDLLFDVPVRGSLADLYLGASVFIAANLSLGLLVSTLAKTQFQAMQVTFMLLLPSILLSGFIFPFDGMPAFARYLGEALPITHFIRIARGIMLREASLLEMMNEVYALLFFTTVVMTAAILRFSRRLD